LFSQFECQDPADTLVGETEARCVSGNINKPYCKCDKCCSKAYKYIDGVNIECTGDSPNFKKSKCSISCGENYELSGIDTLTCTQGTTGWQWGAEWPECIPDLTTTTASTTVEGTTEYTTVSTTIQSETLAPATTTTSAPDLATTTTTTSAPAPTTTTTTTSAPATTTTTAAPTTTTTMMYQDNHFIGLEEVSHSSKDSEISLQWNGGLTAPNDGSQITKQWLRITEGNSNPVLLQLNKNNNRYVLQNVTLGVFYRLEIIINFANGSTYR